MTGSEEQIVVGVRAVLLLRIISAQIQKAADPYKQTHHENAQNRTAQHTTPLRIFRQVIAVISTSVITANGLGSGTLLCGGPITGGGGPTAQQITGG
jgi:hypothetical protein